ncbi:hypothetical protein SVA_3156 [Sulfurifustis variabilis]|uniref:Uncharacterized protein n=1 Tax=Sulfurifustis variabilis TaxID=1675686 RepID=A0A1B4VBH4_9GAMM|nr:hypothetical protein SVA_3156 [Sulfurifustis variabilis]
MAGGQHRAARLVIDETAQLAAIWQAPIPMPEAHVAVHRLDEGERLGPRDGKLAQARVAAPGETGQAIEHDMLGRLEA